MEKECGRIADCRNVWLILGVALAFVSVGVLVVSLYSPHGKRCLGGAVTEIRTW